MCTVPVYVDVGCEEGETSLADIIHGSGLSGYCLTHLIEQSARKTQEISCMTGTQRQLKKSRRPGVLPRDIILAMLTLFKLPIEASQTVR